MGSRSYMQINVTTLRPTYDEMEWIIHVYCWRKRDSCLFWSLNSDEAGFVGF